MYITPSNKSTSFHENTNCVHCVMFPFRKEASLEMEGHFLVRLIYDDAISYDLVGAAVKVLSTRSDTLPPLPFPSLRLTH